MADQPELKIIERVRKLLNLANDKGATEAEASLAAARAAEIMEEHGLSTAMIEAKGGQGEAREKAQQSSAFGAWYEELMAAVAESCFCYSSVTEDKVGGKTRRLHFTIIGRKSAVASANVMYDYLRDTIWRLSREVETDSARFFRHGCAERVIQRLRRRHAETLLRQEQEAEQRRREQAARAAHPSAAPGSSTALVVTLVDYAQRERDLNEDFRRGVPPGTTEAERIQKAAKEAAQGVEFAKLVKAGVDREVAWDMAYLGWSRQKAEEYEARAKVAAAEAAAEEARRAKRQGHRSANREYRETREERKRRHPSFQAGRAAGDKVGLDQQIGRTATRKIGG